MRKISFGLLVLSLILASCSKVVYLENMVPELAYDVHTTELKIRKGDRLSIIVNSKNPEVAAPFNIHSGVSYQVSGDGEISERKSMNTLSAAGGYVVDELGMIDFPILGKISVETLTAASLAEEVQGLLITKKYIDDPIVKVEFNDVKITMMGEVVNNKIISLNGKGLNLLEAITLSGGLTSNAATHKISVIRMQEGVRKMYVADLHSTELFKSPCFVLQQDDIVYVQPLSAKITAMEDRILRYWAVGTGLVTTIISLLILMQ